LRPGRRRLLAVAAAAAAAGLAGGCAAPPMTSALRHAPPSDLPPQAWLADTPFFPDGGTLCGPAVLASLLGAAGRPVDPAALTPEVYLPGRGGSLQLEMLAAARRHGRLAVELRAGPGDGLAGLLRELAAGRPVGVLVNLALALWPRWHYAVLTGYDLPAGTLRLHSGLFAHQSWALTAFESTWARSDHWAFVVLAPGALPVAADADRVSEALLALDRVAAPADAAPAWAAAARRWPDRLTPAIGEGNAWLAAGALDAAAAAFARAAARFDSAAAWNNLAPVELRRGHADAALAAARRAVARADAAEPRWRDAARRTLALAEGRSAP
jgi:tetratricopeptide (TPR) repeat protein